MRIVVVSDTHRSISGFLDKVKTMPKPDLIIHLGDYTSDGEKIEKELGVNVVQVKGNCDMGFSYKDEELIQIRGKKIFLTHGHKYSVKMNSDSLYYKALELGADIVLYGHTHVAEIIREEKIIIMNPGSPSSPRGMELNLTFGLIEITDELKVSIINIH